MSTNSSFDSELQNEIEAALGDASVMDLVDPPATVSAEGQPLRRGQVVAIQGEDILVDVGGKSTGVLPIKQMGDEPLPEVGQTIEVSVSGYDENEGLILLSRKDAITQATWDNLEVGQTVEGRVTGMNKGGLELLIDGLKAFMPISHIDRGYIDDDISVYLNQRFRGKVIEIRRPEKTFVVSRRQLQDEEAAAAREELFKTLQEGQRVTGTVKTIMPYGAFVDIGGADGLLHVREMSYARVDDPADVVKEGQQLEVAVLKIDREKRKIGLGLKQVMADPWQDVESKWHVDTVVSGRVTRLADFGAFVELEPGVEGLVPISELSFERRVGHPKEIVSPDEVIKVRVLAVDKGRRRISLSIKRVGDDPWMGASVRWQAESVTEGRVKKIADFGAFVELAPGVEGLVHISELADNHVRSVGDVLEVGQKVQAKVLSVEEDRRRIALSIKQAHVVDDWNGELVAAQAAAAPNKQKRRKPRRGGLER